MKNAIILHGMPSKEEYFDENLEAPSNQHWLPWIQRRLLLKGILAQAIELPEPYKPDYEKYASVFEQNDINEETILIGHSCGAGFLVRWLTENKIQVGRVVLVAPWLDPEREYTHGFFDFVIDPDVPNRSAGLTIFNSNDDMEEVQESVRMLVKVWSGAKLIEFTNKGHFCFEDMKTREFPELEAEILE